MIDSIEQRLIFKPREICLNNNQDLLNQQTDQVFLTEIDLDDLTTGEEQIDAKQTWNNKPDVNDQIFVLSDRTEEETTKISKFLASHKKMFARTYGRFF